MNADEVQADQTGTNFRPKTADMSPAEYAAFTGKMSFPAGEAKAQTCQAADADYVDRFVRQLEDPEIRLVTEKPHDWTNWGAAGKAAILAVVREGVASIRARAKTEST